MVAYLFRRVRTGTHIDHPAVEYHTTSRVTIDAPDPLDLFADGEPLARTPVTLEVLPRALDVISPPSES